jgi:chemotaxis protein CheD
MTDHYIDIFLQPGDFYFGDQETRIRTILGSCVAITLWHPRLLIGGMCHYMLPMRHQRNKLPELDGRYANDAMALFLGELKKTRTWPADYQVKIFGGGDQFPHHEPNQYQSISLPENNIYIGHSLLKQHGFTIKAVHLGGTGHRNIIFDVWSGEVWVKHVDIK